jgi:hypothetical protein
MQTLYIVIKGSYEYVENLHVFGDKNIAERWALEYNAAHPWSNKDDRARVEEIGYTPLGDRPPTA